MALLLRVYGQYTPVRGININGPSERPWLACELKIKISVRHVRGLVERVTVCRTSRAPQSAEQCRSLHSNEIWGDGDRKIS